MIRSERQFYRLASHPLLNVTGDNLLLDLNIDDKNKASIWVTETTLGGAGVLESFATKFSEEPDLFSAIEAALARQILS